MNHSVRPLQRSVRSSRVVDTCSPKSPGQALYRTRPQHRGSCRPRRAHRMRWNSSQGDRSPKRQPAAM